MLSVLQLVEATGGTQLSGADGLLFRAISTDTRTLQPGDLYVPLVGETFDGHAYVQQALEKGAAGFLWGSEQPDPTFAWPEATGVVVVDDTLKAYGDMARFWRRLVNCTVVAVTGSSGKTSTKEFVAELLRRQWRVVKTEGNFNNEIGVPKTLLEIRPGDQVCVVEMGMRGEGQIKRLASIAEPDLGIITNVGPAHLSELGSMDAVASAKWELAEYLDATRGQLVLNADNQYLHGLAAVFAHERLSWVSTDAKNDWATFVATEQHLGEGKQAFTYRDLAGIERKAAISLMGEHQVNNALLAIAVGTRLGMALPDRVEILPSPLAGRGEELCLREVTFINEAYNANPASMAATLKTFAGVSGRKIAVLGEMRELGPNSAEMHREIGHLLATLPIDILVTVGGAAREIAAGAIEGGLPTHRIRQFDDSMATSVALMSEMEPGDRVLLKASRAARLEDVLIEIRTAWDS